MKAVFGSALILLGFFVIFIATTPTLTPGIDSFVIVSLSFAWVFIALGLWVISTRLRMLLALSLLVASVASLVSAGMAYAVWNGSRDHLANFCGFFATVCLAAASWSYAKTRYSVASAIISVVVCCFAVAVIGGGVFAARHLYISREQDRAPSKTEIRQALADDYLLSLRLARRCCDENCLSYYGNFRCVAVTIDSFKMISLDKHPTQRGDWLLRADISGTALCSHHPPRRSFELKDAHIMLRWEAPRQWKASLLEGVYPP